MGKISRQLEQSLAADNDSKLRVLLVTRGVLQLNKHTIGGAEHYAIRIAERLVSHGHEVHLVADCSTETSVDLMAKGITVHPIGLPKYIGKIGRRSGFLGWAGLHLVGNLLGVRGALRVLRTHTVDVAHCHGELTAVALTRLSKGVPVVFTLHDAGPWLGEYESWVERSIRRGAFSLLDVRALRRASCSTLMFNALKEHLVSEFKVDGEKLHVISPGVDVDLFATPEHNESRQDFLFVGSLVWRKGVDILIDLLKALPWLKLNIIGDGPERRWLEQVIVRENLSDRARLLGHVPNCDLPLHLAQARALILPSRSEGLPLIVLESLSCGTPVVATDVGGVKDVVRDGWSGFLRKRDDVKGLAEALQQLQDDPSLAAQLGENGRSLVTAQFTWEQICSQMEDVYREAANSHIAQRAR